MATIIVEYRYRDPLTDEQLEATSRDLDPALARHGASWKRSYASEDRLRLICELSGKDADSVAEAHREVAVPYEAVWTGERWTLEEVEAERAHEHIVKKEEAAPAEAPRRG